ncbi:non-homologous end joining protein Ku [Phenylobacterium montanum]|uniref:Non-homologous end joining protein Ku n=1 Tax=Phenylobacterium montanum TaxID=2823693 RepID=A0A975IVW5_9CAUL|nr:Ku protein [Caulobacter sp. S6]QUD89268.1 Ku protein [Caulobacter sp. S6]
MALRPTWQGHLRLSLVTCPVSLYAATTRAGDVHFHLINPKTDNRIRMTPTDPDTGPVERAELVKGYEVDRDQYVLLTPEDLDSVRLESTRTIDIERFVPAADIDRLYWDAPYFLVPDGDLAQEAFSVIREALKASEKLALGRVVIASRERMLALEPRGPGMVASTLRSADEVRESSPLFEPIKPVKPDPDMIAIAEKIIDQRSGPFDPSQFVDRYEEALKELIARKSKGRRPVSAPEPEDTNVVDLMQALRRSLKSTATTGDARHRVGERSKRSGRKRSSK